MKKSALIGCTAALISCAAMAASHEPLVIHKQAQRFITALPGGKTLVDQNKDASGAAVLSSNGSDAADEFAVPKGHTWIVKEVDVTGVYFNGSGPASSENVSFYKDKGGLPGKLITECDNVTGRDNGTGSFAIDLSKCQTTLKGGKTYWVSVVANLNFGEDGDWGWELSSDTTGNYAVCSSGGRNCVSYPGELMFDLKGKDKS